MAFVDELWWTASFALVVCTLKFPLCTKLASVALSFYRFYKRSDIPPWAIPLYLTLFEEVSHANQCINYNGYSDGARLVVLQWRKLPLKEGLPVVKTPGQCERVLWSSFVPWHIYVYDLITVDFLCFVNVSHSFQWFPATKLSNQQLLKNEILQFDVEFFGSVQSGYRCAQAVRVYVLRAVRPLCSCLPHCDMRSKNTDLSSASTYTGNLPQQ